MSSDAVFLSRESEALATEAPRRRRWIFRAFAIALPFAILVFAELALRLGGYGHPTTFFLRKQIGTTEMLIENPRFSWHFFPPSIARMQVPVCVPLKKAPGTIRIFVFGESAAMGDPNPDFGCARILETLLRARHPATKFEVINVAMTAINSHAIREIAQECAGLEGDYWVVYMGNNEVVGPYGAGTVFGSQTANLTAIRLSLWLKKLRLGQWISRLRDRGATEWKGMEMFLHQQVGRDDPRLAMVYRHFAANLDDIVRFGRNAGARVVLSTVAVNLKDCPPFASQSRRGRDGKARAEWQRLFAAGCKAEQDGAFTAALAAFEAAARVGNGTVETETHAELHFRLGRCLLALGRSDEAAARFERARDLDTLRFRADSEIDRLIAAKAAAEKDGILFVPFAALAAAASPGKISGDELFYEHVHLTFEGNYRLARALFEEIETDVRQHGKLSNDVGPVLSQADCATALAWTEWERLAVDEQVTAHLQQPPFATQSGSAERLARGQRRIAALSERVQANPFANTVGAYRSAIERRSDDWVLHRNLALFFELADPNTAHAAEASNEWREVTRLLPHYPQAYFHLGNVAKTQGRIHDAIGYYRETLAHDPVGDPDLLEVRFCLGSALLEANRLAEALPHLRAVAREFPNFAAARFNYGSVLERQGRVSDAEREYRATLRLEPNFKPAQAKLAEFEAAQPTKALFTK